MNKIGVSFNLWKGEEFIPYAINQIKDYVDYIVVIYQTESNYKDLRNDLSSTLNKWVETNLIDEWVDYKPDFDCSENYWGIHNELKKRNIGLQKCLDNGCNYLLDSDSDEIYNKVEFKNCIEEVITGGYDSSFCKMITYYKYPDCKLSPIENYYVPFIYKINYESEFKPIHNIDFPVLVDGKRRIKSKVPLVFSEQEILMHHYSYVRLNENEMLDKFNNASSRLNFSNQRISDILNSWNNFEIGGKALIGKDQEFSTKKTDNLFNIKL